MTVITPATAIRTGDRQQVVTALLHNARTTTAMGEAAWNRGDYRAANAAWIAAARYRLAAKRLIGADK